MNSSKKRKNDANDSGDSKKRTKMTKISDQSAENSPEPANENIVTGEKQKEREKKRKEKKPRPRINKLTPPKPFPTVPASVSATGPRSGHREGKNMICLTRKTSLANYMRRCKDVIIKDGYNTLHLSAMGAAIPLLVQLVCALPPILPFSKDEIRSEFTTGTVEVTDEIIPENEDEDLEYKMRGKSVLRVALKIGDGQFDGNRSASRKYSAGKTVGKNKAPAKEKSKKVKIGQGKKKGDTGAVVFEEPEQEEFVEML